MGLGSWLGSLIGGATASGVSESLNGIADAGLKVREIVTGEPTPEKLLEAVTHIDDLISRANDAANKVNEAEAKSGSLFTAGWRPAVGWVCAISIGLYYIPRFILGMAFWALHVYGTGNLLPLPEMGIQEVLGLIGTLLGMATLRSVDKNNGVQNNH